MHHSTENAAMPQGFTHPDDELPPYVQEAFDAGTPLPSPNRVRPRRNAGKSPPPSGIDVSLQRVPLQFGNAALVMIELADEMATSSCALMPALASTSALLECVHHAALDETNIPQSTLRDAITGIQVLVRLATAFAKDTRVLLAAQGGNGNG